MTSLFARWFLAAGIVVATALPLRAAELLMFEEDWCHWCEAWNEAIGVIYDKTEEGQRAPLRRVDIHGTFPNNVKLESRPHYTPTFVLVHEGKEIGRIEGYPGEDFFWGLLARLLERLPAETTSATGG
ncbi:MAG: hypothetical protein AAF409_06215 [Pseudomonadota bacterium]